ncbi:hypothetical protein BKK79_03135 [Cupriavidus sp. USMAA2-4]|uniref:NIPSNAP domain-containing protein n=2 Tax=Burkholderiaceae TaxID=119060 RepID=A0ABN4TKQ5_9BURK|nr:hypothetical protein BKK79_03135 [Cupriavidus sp. USMAA2-4]AOZ06125.1 hypothetical protein BKK80_09985 [Cupriavidus malaysiensis]
MLPMCARIRLKPGSLPRVREWAAHLREHRAEALRTLAAEGVSIESVFLDSSADGDFLVYYMRAASEAQARQAAQASTAAIDDYHRAFKRDTWAQLTRLELLVDLQCEAGPSPQGDAGPADTARARTDG